jgi:hypothetical protein
MNSVPSGCPAVMAWDFPMNVVVDLYSRLLILMAEYLHVQYD